MIIQISGPVGAGKTHLMRSFMKWGVGFIPELDDVGREIGYSGFLKNESCFVIGDYRRVCGGAEGLRQSVVKERIRWAMQHHDHVLFEGMMVSTCFGTYAALLQDWAPGRHAFAFIHPPIEVCAQRVVARRAARGDVRPYKNTNNYHHAYIGRAIQRAEMMGAPHVVLDWEKPLPGLLKLLKASRKSAGKKLAA